MKEEPVLYGVKDTIEALSNVGKAKGSVRPSKLLLAGFAAGAYIAFGFMLAITASAGFHPMFHDGQQWYLTIFKILLGAVFPVGLIAVVIGGADLWTGNCQIVPLAKMLNKISFKRVLYNWVTSYTGCFIGSVFLAFLATYATGLFTPENIFGQVTEAIAKYKVGLTPWKAFWLGVGCNWLVNVAIWLAVRTKDSAGKILAIWFPIFAFVAIGFEHSVANMWAIPTGIFLSNHGITWIDYFNNIIPVSIGNAIGGWLFVAFYYWYLGYSENPAKEIIDYTVLLLIFVVLMLLIPLGIAYAIETLVQGAALWLFPVVYGIYGIILAYLTYKW
ncbi:formate/nitrite transporter family protein [Desulfurococcaceae archaeon MEX13E-LK6-19]|nr:formate/nitrite transporter family protein [Desulfurococcaceae archaeon MEX13E-LK6-19]